MMLAPETGKLELGVFGDMKNVGGFVDYSHRIAENVGAFARAEGGYDFVAESGFLAGYAGLRVLF